MGIQLGIEKKEKVIIKAIKERIKSSTLITHESCTLGECISANSNIILPLLVLKGKIY